MLGIGPQGHKAMRSTMHQRRRAMLWLWRRRRCCLRSCGRRGSRSSRRRTAASHGQGHTIPGALPPTVYTCSYNLEVGINKVQNDSQRAATVVTYHIAYLAVFQIQPMAPARYARCGCIQRACHCLHSHQGIPASSCRCCGRAASAASASNNRRPGVRHNNMHTCFCVWYGSDTRHMRFPLQSCW